MEVRTLTVADAGRLRPVGAQPRCPARTGVQLIVAQRHDAGRDALLQGRLWNDEQQRQYKRKSHSVLPGLHSSDRHDRHICIGDTRWCQEERVKNV